MPALSQLLQSIGFFLAGLLARSAAVVVMMLAFAVPVLLVALVLRGARAVRAQRLGLTTVEGLSLRPALRYAPTHTWLARRSGGDLAVGLDDLALRLLPTVTGVEVARPGTEVRAGDPIATVFAGIRHLTVLAPVDGRVVGPNRAVRRDPSLLRRDGYGRGWLVALAPRDGACEQLPTGEAAARFMAGEAHRWNQYVEAALGYAAADGGQLVAPAPSLLDERSWEALAATFLGGK